MKKIGGLLGVFLAAGVVCAEVTVANVSAAQTPGTKQVINFLFADDASEKRAATKSFWPMPLSRDTPSVKRLCVPTAFAFPIFSKASCRCWNSTAMPTRSS